MEEQDDSPISTIVLTASASTLAYGLTDAGTVFVGAGIQEFEERDWVLIGILHAALTLGHPLLVRIRGGVTATSVVVASQRLPFPIAVDPRCATDVTAHHTS